MPVPVWDCSELPLLDEPLDTATVISDDIWKKFDMDFPVDNICDMRSSFDDGVLLEPMALCQPANEIRHHDCMWAGLCISKEHNSRLQKRRKIQMTTEVPAGTSLLKSKALPMQSSNADIAIKQEYSSQPSALRIQQSSQQQQQQQQQYQQQQSQQFQSHYQQQSASQQQCRTPKNLESDGDSSRPETPQSSESDVESEVEAPVFKHEQISIEKLSETIFEDTMKAVPASDVSGQMTRKLYERKRLEELQKQQQQLMQRETEIRQSLSDHCYHLSQPAATSINNKRPYSLGIQTPSDTGELLFFFFQ